MTISDNWIPEERIMVATVLLSIIQSDIYANKYGLPGRPNITSVLHVLHEEAAVLNQFRESLDTVLAMEATCRHPAGR